jgi:hypothetical protein
MGRLTPLALAVALTCVAVPAAARAGTPARAPRLLPLERAACLFPIPGQECTEEEHGRVCTQCSDPNVEWVQEMVGKCDMPPRAGDPVVIDADRDHPREPTCLDGEACGAPRPPLAGGGTTVDVQPVACAGHAALVHYAPGGRLIAAVLLRDDPGHPPRLLRPPNG